MATKGAGKRDIIFMDGEFAQLKPDGIDLLSIALIKQTGEELYIELDFKGKVDPWVRRNVLPHLKGRKIPRDLAAERIRAFLGPEKPFLIAYVNQFDWMGICRLFDASSPEEISERVPFHWIPIDLASILFENGFSLDKPLIQQAHQLGIDVSQTTSHNALDDARILKQVYEKISARR